MSKEVIEYEKCHMNGDYYDKNEMAYCNQGGLWVHKSNIKEYVKECEPFMLSSEAQELETNLLNQVK